MEHPHTSSVQITPIAHASMIVSVHGQSIYTDPVGGKALFAQHPAPTLILITDIHPDHLDAVTLGDISKENTVIVVPPSVALLLPDDIPGNILIIENGETITESGIEIEAIPMYNLPESSESKHTKGRGNGYVVTAGENRIYIAGDTDAIPEMKALRGITMAFIPMNPPYTMSVEQAAEAVVAFKPKVVHPYHYRTPDGLSDISHFKSLVEVTDPSITVELLNFYQKSTSE